MIEPKTRPAVSPDSTIHLGFLERPAWMARANCRGLSPELFFPDSRDNCREAKQVCAGCPVRSECLEFGLHATWGVWGGAGERERRRVRVQRRRAS